MADLNPFSESNLKELKIFPQKLKRRYPAISLIALYHGPELEHPYVLLIEIQDKDKSEYHEALNDPRRQ